MPAPGYGDSGHVGDYVWIGGMARGSGWSVTSSPLLFGLRRVSLHGSWATSSMVSVFGAAACAELLDVSKSASGRAAEPVVHFVSSSDQSLGGNDFT